MGNSNSTRRETVVQLNSLFQETIELLYNRIESMEKRISKLESDIHRVRSVIDTTEERAQSIQMELNATREEEDDVPKFQDCISKFDIRLQTLEKTIKSSLKRRRRYQCRGLPAGGCKPSLRTPSSTSSSALSSVSVLSVQESLKTPYKQTSKDSSRKSSPLLESPPKCGLAKCSKMKKSLQIVAVGYPPENTATNKESDSMTLRNSKRSEARSQSESLGTFEYPALKSRVESERFSSSPSMSSWDENVKRVLTAQGLRSPSLEEKEDDAEGTRESQQRLARESVSKLKSLITKVKRFSRGSKSSQGAPQSKSIASQRRNSALSMSLVSESATSRNASVSETSFTEEVTSEERLAKPTTNVSHDAETGRESLPHPPPITNASTSAQTDQTDVLRPSDFDSLYSVSVDSDLMMGDSGTTGGKTSSSPVEKEEESPMLPVRVRNTQFPFDKKRESEEPRNRSSLVEAQTSREDVGASALHVAAGQGRLAEVRALVHAGVDPAAPDANGNNALHWAARFGHSDALLFLLKNSSPAAKRARGEKDNTPLHMAAQHGHTACVQLLLRAGAPVHVKDKHGLTALELSIMHGQPNVTKILRPFGIGRVKSWEDDSATSEDSGSESDSNQGDDSGKPRRGRGWASREWKARKYRMSMRNTVTETPPLLEERAREAHEEKKRDQSVHSKATH